MPNKMTLIELFENASELAGAVFGKTSKPIIPLVFGFSPAGEGEPDVIIPFPPGEPEAAVLREVRRVFARQQVTQFFFISEMMPARSATSILVIAAVDSKWQVVGYREIANPTGGRKRILGPLMRSDTLAAASTLQPVLSLLSPVENILH